MMDSSKVMTIEMIDNSEGVPIPYCFNTGSPLISEIDPVSEAKQILKYLPVDEAQLIVIAGLGFGYLINEVRNVANENARILVIDNDEEIISMSSGLLEDLLKDERIYLAVGNDAEVNQQISNFLGLNRIFVHRMLMLNSYYYSQNERVIYTRKLLEQFRKLRNIRQFQAGNAPDDTILGIKHLMENLPAVINTIGISRWKDRFKGMPAICVASGPSLDQHIDLLRNIGDKALIIAADSVAEKLYKEGIKPHMISIVERVELIYDAYFKEKKFHPESIVVAYSSIYPNIVKEFPGKLMLMGRIGIHFETRLADVLPSYDVMELGQSCAHTSYTTALSLGCEPIILVGQDLAYGTDLNTHAAGINTPEMQDHIDNAHIKMGKSLAVKGWHGGEVVTNYIWNKFLEFFEEAFLKTDRTVINATQGGAFINGAKHIPFKDAIAKLNEKQGVGSLLKEMNEAETLSTKEDVKRLKEHLSNEIVSIDNWARVVDELSFVGEQVKLAAETENYKLFAKMTDEYTKKLYDGIKKCHFANQVCQYLVLKYTEKANNILIATDEDTWNWVYYLEQLTQNLNSYTLQIRELLERGLWGVNDHFPE